VSKIVKVAAAIATALALIALPTAPAFASTITASTPGSNASYNTTNLYLTAADTLCDGKSAIAEIKHLGDTYPSWVKTSTGCGTSSRGFVSTVTAPYQIRACVQDIGGGGPKTCGSWQTYNSGF